VKLQLLAEVFNVFNRNMPVVTGANQDLFRVTYCAAVSSSCKTAGTYLITKYTNTVSGTALNTFGVSQGYSGEVSPRQLQVAAKISF
jgi:putative Ca2+/H+ antiporter (TMEM165/GDT1 family)